MLKEAKQEKKKQKMKVQIAANIKRESVLINPALGVNAEAEDNNVIATGVSGRALVKQIYGRRR